MKRKIRQYAVGALAALLLLAGAELPVAAATAAKVAQVQVSQPVSASQTAQAGGRWITSKGKRYRLDANGKRIIGYFTVNNKRYYAWKTGVVVVKAGWFTRSDGKRAYAYTSGIIKAGVARISGKMYYTDAYGVARNGHFKGVNNNYYVTKNGLITPGWNKRGAKEYYVRGNGALLVGTQTIGGKTYVFDATGVLTKGAMLTVTRNGQVVTDTAANILARVVMAEVGGFNNPETFKAQAIAAHSYILYEIAHGTKAPSVPDKAPTPMVVQAVNEVANIVVKYNGQPAFTSYYASSNGKTNPCGDFWKTNIPYLTTVDSAYDKQSTNYQVTTTRSRAWFLQMMDKVYGANNYVLDANPSNWIGVTYNAAGYAKTSVRVGNRNPSVEYFYQNMVGIRSASFTVKYVAATDSFQFTTLGYGHGVGMSQWGAYFYTIKRGWNYKQILAHYYPGTALANV